MEEPAPAQAAPAQAAPAQATPAAPAKRAPTKRPFGVTIVAVLLLVQGLYLVTLAAAVISIRAAEATNLLRHLVVVDVARIAVRDWISAVLVGVLGVFIVLSGVGVLRLRPWAWLAAMALQGWTLALFLFDYLTHGQSSVPTALLSVIIVFYLNSRTVRRTFDLVSRRESDPAALEAVAPATAGTAAAPTRPLRRAQ